MSRSKKRKRALPREVPAFRDSSVKASVAWPLVGLVAGLSLLGATVLKAMLIELPQDASPFHRTGGERGLFGLAQVLVGFVFGGIVTFQGVSLLRRPLFTIRAETLQINNGLVSRELRYAEIDEVIRYGRTASLRVRGKDIRLPLRYLSATQREEVLGEIQRGRERSRA